MGQCNNSILYGIQHPGFVHIGTDFSDSLTGDQVQCSHFYSSQAVLSACTSNDIQWMSLDFEEYLSHLEVPLISSMVTYLHRVYCAIWVVLQFEFVSSKLLNKNMQGIQLTCRRKVIWTYKEIYIALIFHPHFVFSHIWEILQLGRWLIIPRNKVREGVY